MKRLFTLIIFLVSLVAAKAQESSIFSHYYAYPFLVNPGYTGFDEHQLLLNFKNGWTGFPGAPRTLSFGYNGPVNARSGIGFQVFSDKVASLSTFKAQVNYAYFFKVQNFKVGTGLSGEFQVEKIVPDAGTDPLTQPNDQVLDDALGGFNSFDVSAGLYARDDNGIFFGLVFPDMVRARLDKDVVGGKAAMAPLQNYTIMAGVKHKMPDYGIILEPSVMFRKYRVIPLQVDFNFLGSILEEKVYLGLSYRAGRASRGGVLAGFRVGFGTLLYSYNHSFRKFQDLAGGGHELSLKFNLNNALGQSETPPLTTN